MHKCCSTTKALLPRPVLSSSRVGFRLNGRSGSPYWTMLFQVVRHINAGKFVDYMADLNGELEKSVEQIAAEEKVRKALAQSTARVATPTRKQVSHAASVKSNRIVEVQADLEVSKDGLDNEGDLDDKKPEAVKPLISTPV